MCRLFSARILAMSLFLLCLLPLRFRETLPFTTLNTSASAQEEGYLSQTLIDTMVQQAFYQFHLAETAIDPQKSQQRAIEYAKGVVRKLRRMARGDDNEKYILWKLSELEQHIYLEEKDLLLAKMKEGQKSLNQLINQYNAELGKNRPDFRMLVALHKQIERIDIRKANQIASSINQRNRNISREVMQGLENKLLTGNYASAREDLDYCQSQEGYLNVSQNRCSQWEKQLADMEKANFHRAGLTEQLERAEKLVREKKLSTVWGQIPQLQKTINSSTDLSDRQAIELRSRVSRLVKKIDRLEDSLFNCNISILRQQGIDPAIEFMQTVLLDYNVSRSCIMRVDSAIMAVSPKTEEGSGKIRRELNSLVHGGGSHKSLTMESARDIAHRRAQAKIDSIRAVEEARARKAALEQAHRDSIRLVELQKRERMLRKYREKARGKMMKIVELLNKGRVKKAYKQFKRNRGPMKKYMEESTYAFLEQTVLQAYRDRKNRKKKRKQRDIIIVEDRPQKMPGKPVVSQKQDNLKPDEQHVQKTQSVRDDSARRKEKGRQEAQQVIIDIYTLLENNKIRQAYNRFDANRELMDTQIGGEPYAMLEKTVMQSYQNLQEFVQNTSEPTAGQASSPRVEYQHDTQPATESPESQSHSGPGETHRGTAQDTPDQLPEEKVNAGAPQEEEQFNDETAMNNDYFSPEKASDSGLDQSRSDDNTPSATGQTSSDSEPDENQRKAQWYISRLYKLLEQNQVKEAYVRFQEIREPLKKYSDPAAYQTLENILIQSYQNLDSN